MHHGTEHAGEEAAPGGLFFCMRYVLKCPWTSMLSSIWPTSGNVPVRLQLVSYTIVSTAYHRQPLCTAGEL